MPRGRRKREEKQTEPKRLEPPKPPPKSDPPPPRIGGKWRQIALLLRRLADLIEAPEEGDLPERSKPRRRAPLPPPPLDLPPPSEIDMQRAKEDLRRLGYRVK